LILDHHPLAVAGSDVLGVLNGLADRLAKAGAKVERAGSRLPDLAASHGQFMAMLGLLLGMRSPRPAGAPPPMSAEAWVLGLHAREGFRQAWEALFKTVDAVLTPPLGTAAFPHDDSPMAGRTLTIDGAQVPYFGQLAWPGIATFPGLPATCAPAGRTPAGLPVGVQIIGPYWEDRTTIALAGLIERELPAA